MIHAVSSYTSAPWVVSTGICDASDHANFYVTTTDGKSIANCGPMGESNAKHIVNCVSSLALIHSILASSLQWNADTLDSIAEVLSARGFPIEYISSKDAE